MIKDLYKQKGWTATNSIVRKNRVEVKLTSGTYSVPLHRNCV